MREQIQDAPEALSVTRKCHLAGVCRATYYRHRLQSSPEAGTTSEPMVEEERQDKDKELRQALHRLAVETTGCGYRRMTHHLRREGKVVNSKKVRRLMREEHLLYAPPKRFVVTTDSDHEGLIYPNLAKGMKVTQPDRLWVADITYVRLPEGFCYLAAIVDAYSRRCIGVLPCGWTPGPWKAISMPVCP